MLCTNKAEAIYPFCKHRISGELYILFYYFESIASIYKKKDYAEYKHGSIIKQKIQVLLISTLIETAFNQIILRNHGSGFRKRSK